MRVTTEHPASTYGKPVIISDKGSVMDYASGTKAVRAKLKLTTKELADACNVSRRTVEGWEQGRPIDAAALNVMARLLRGRVRGKPGSQNATNK